MEELIKMWQERQKNYEDLAEKHRDNEHNCKKFTYKAMATRDCWKELLTEVGGDFFEKPMLAVVFVDKTGSQLNNGDIINIHQTVNGENLFIVLDVYNLDIRYAHNLAYKYQYDMLELLSPSRLNGDIDFEIVGNLHPHLENYR